MKLSTLLFFWLSAFSGLAVADDTEDLNKQCSNLGQEFLAKHEKQYAYKISRLKTSEFHYNNKLATCLAYTEVVEAELNKMINSVWYHRLIIDINRNKVVARSRYFILKDDQTKTVTFIGNYKDRTDISPTEFNTTKAQLFAQ